LNSSAWGPTILAVSDVATDPVFLTVTLSAWEEPSTALPKLTAVRLGLSVPDGWVRKKTSPPLTASATTAAAAAMIRGQGISRLCATGGTITATHWPCAWGSMPVSLTLALLGRAGLADWLLIGQVALGLVCQAAVAVLVAAWSERLGTVHALFASFVCGIVVSLLALAAGVATLSEHLRLVTLPLALVTGAAAGLLRAARRGPSG